MQYIFRPLATWPGEFTRSRKRSKFDSTWSATLDLLDRELRRLHARDVMIQAAVEERDIRRDGMLRQDARPSHPGVILSFESRFGSLRYPCDAFTDWRDNLRAIALALEALRKVDRYGVTKRAEQYSGWKALSAASSEPNADLRTADDAATWLAKYVSDHGIPTGPQHAKQAPDVVYRNAAKFAHPDSPTGGEATFKRLTKAHQLLKGA